MKRFLEIQITDIEIPKEKKPNKNTGLATERWIKVFQTWSITQGLSKAIERYSVDELNKVLEKFYAEVRRQNGKDYEPESLAVMQSCIDRYLRENDYRVSITRSKEFQSSQQVLEAKILKLRQEGRGNKPDSVKILTKEDEEILWNCGQLGNHHPKSLQNAMWLFITRQFGVKGRQEHYSLRMDQFEVKTNDIGQEYVTRNEDLSESENHVSQHSKRAKLNESKMCATGTKRCPVAFFKKFVEKRPLNLKNYGPFYLGCLEKVKENEPWYKSSALGINSVNCILRNMITGSPLDIDDGIKHYIVIPRKCDILNTGRTILENYNQREMLNNSSLPSICNWVSPVNNQNDVINKDQETDSEIVVMSEMYGDALSRTSSLEQQTTIDCENLDQAADRSQADSMSPDVMSDSTSSIDVNTPLIGHLREAGLLSEVSGLLSRAISRDEVQFRCCQQQSKDLAILIDCKLKEIDRIESEVETLRIKQTRCNDEAANSRKRLASCINAIKELPMGEGGMPQSASAAPPSSISENKS